MKAIPGLLAMLFLVFVSLANAADKPPPAALGDVIALTLDHACEPLNVVQKYKLLVNGAYTGIAAQGCQNVTTTTGQVQFLLRKDSDPPAADTAAAWRTLIGGPWTGPGTATEREITFGISDGAGMDVPTTDGDRMFRWSPGWKMFAGALVFLVVIFIFVLLAWKTALLRDVGSTASVGHGQRTFSLARTQMAWWTLIIVGSYIYEWMASGTMPPLSAQALALMGIYSVLTVGSRSVDLARDTHFPPSVPLFFRDLVSDESGVAIHRLQMLIFTIIVGLMFAYQVLTTTSMPPLEPYTLAIIGISGATYIGLKSTEPTPKPVDGLEQTAPVETAAPDPKGPDSATADPATSNDVKSAYTAGEPSLQQTGQDVGNDPKSAYSAG